MSSWYQSLADSRSDFVGKEVVALQEKYFDHSAVLGQEIDYFLREFETRRNDKDTESLAGLVQAMKHSNGIFGFMLADTHLAAVSALVHEAQAHANEILPHEAKYDERRGPREAELKKEFEIQRGVYELEVQQFREAVLTSFAEKAAAIREKYFIDEEGWRLLEEERERNRQYMENNTWFGKRA